MSLLEDVIDFNKKREEREGQEIAKGHKTRGIILSSLDQAIAQAVDAFRSDGLANKEAVQKVIDHLDDIVSGFDLGGAKGLGFEEENEDLKRSMQSVRRQAAALKPRKRDEEKYARSKAYQEQKAREYEEWANSPEGQEQLAKVAAAWEDYGRQRAKNPKEWTGD